VTTTRRSHGPLITSAIRPPHQPPSRLAGARAIALGGVAVLALVIGIVAGFLILDGKRNGAVRVRISGSGLIVGCILKDIFQRPRPDLVPRVAYFTGASFLSAHSMMSTVTYLTLRTLLARSMNASCSTVFPRTPRRPLRTA
jgi:hypothetical protein